MKSPNHKEELQEFELIVDDFVRLNIDSRYKTISSLNYFLFENFHPMGKMQKEYNTLYNRIQKNMNEMATPRIWIKNE